ncbi:MAG: NADP(H)-dependent aldo-keto reductase [Motiliproteus sp.]|nr:NADP(H)-dependent aldo-keto reductase [Motiliproteus sp.]MCW9051372.1 NADP(H)-dependent aldo-keto reductase [Motiliproteus sp.]
MKYNQLGNSDLKVSRICLGTMTWGGQNSEKQAHEQLDYAFSRGVNFLDTAEMYPIPPAQHHYGDTERFIGSWMKKRGNREQVVIASKVAGPGAFVSYIREDMRLDRSNIRAAIEGSLQRLGTDYIDLYQLHWPDRVTNFFGQHDYRHKPKKDGTPLLETLEALSELVKEGLVRQIGVSNETPWGLMRYLALAEQHDLPGMVTVQNPYNLLNRTLEVGLTEVLLRENVDLLAYSPLAFGTLTGKYLNGQMPAGSRLALYKHYVRYITEAGMKATEQYVELARDHGLEPNQMALAFVTQQPFVGGNIIGATSMEQLRSNLDSIELTLSDDLLTAIDKIHLDRPNPCP